MQAIQNTLITGGEHSDRISYAHRLAKNWLCEKPVDKEACSKCNNCLRTLELHPNIIFIEPETNGNEETSLGTIKIDQVRRIISENHKANFEKALGIFLITHMHQATKSAANAMLKAIEENHKDKVFIALAPSRMTVLPTIASRMSCHVVEPTPLQDFFSADVKNKIFDISKMPSKERFSCSQNFNHERDHLIKELQELRDACHILLRQKAVPARFALLLSNALEQAQGLLKKNANPRLVLEQLIFNDWPFMDLN